MQDTEESGEDFADEIDDVPVDEDDEPLVPDPKKRKVRLAFQRVFKPLAHVGPVKKPSSKTAATKPASKKAKSTSSRAKKAKPTDVAEED